MTADSLHRCDPPPDRLPAALRDVPVAELVTRARNGSRASYGEIVARFESRLFNFLLRRAGSHADAEDIAQETFVRAWQRLDQYDARWQFSTWLFTIGGRLAISRLRRERGRRPLTIDAGGSAPARLAAADPAQVAADREQCGRLWGVADRVLSDTQRAALWLRYAEDLPPRTIAHILGKSPIGVRVMLFRARQALAEHCSERSDERPRGRAPSAAASRTGAAGAARGRPKTVPGGVP